MAQRILRVTSEWCADTEEEVQNIIEHATDEGGELTKKLIELKQKKSKGEVVAEHFKVTTQVTYDEIWSDYAPNKGGDE